MRNKRATHLILALLLAAGLGVCANPAAAAQSAAKKKSAAGKSTSNKTAPHKSAATAAKPKTTKSSKSSRRPRSTASLRNKGQKAPTSDRITEIQQALAKDGSFSGDPSGKWDGSTTDAMRKFQQSHGLNPSGKLDAKTLQQLGLGSQTAGVAPPLPPVSSSSTMGRDAASSDAARRQ
jgi:peptidoglycan hydrolase-like protein with peptidoglycan-binding domain